MRRIAHLSDLHFGRHDPDVVAALTETLARIGPDLVVVSGDLTQRARRAEFAAAAEFLNAVAGPRLVVPGNHDLPLFNWPGRLVAPTWRYDRHIAPLALPDAFYADAEIGVLGLNTARRLRVDNGTVSRRELALLRTAFTEVPATALKVLVTHHPLGGPAGTARIQVARRSAETLQACLGAGVTLLLSGHHHIPLSGPVAVGDVAELTAGRALLVVHAGTAVSTRTKPNEPNSFNLLEIEAGRVRLTLMRWSRAGGFGMHSGAEFRLDDGRWRKPKGA